MRGGNRGGNSGNRQNSNRNSNFGNNQQEEQQRRREQAFTTQDIKTSTITQRTPQRTSDVKQPQTRSQSGPRTLPNGRVKTQSGREFGAQQSTIAKGVGAQQKAKAGTKGSKRAATAQNAQQNNPRARLPNLDDLNEDNINGRDGRRFVDYDEWYATTDPVSNKLKEKLKRSKLRNKKGTGLLGTLDVKSGNSVLDSYRNLGRKLITSRR